MPIMALRPIYQTEENEEEGERDRYIETRMREKKTVNIYALIIYAE
jgi:hypothetical protein